MSITPPRLSLRPGTGPGPLALHVLSAPIAAAIAGLPTPRGRTLPMRLASVAAALLRSLSAALAALAASAGVAWALDEPYPEGLVAEPPAARPTADADVVAAVAALETAFSSTDVPVREAGARAAAAHDHAKLADVLLRYHGKEKEPVVRFAIVDALGVQSRSAAKVGARLHAALEKVVAGREDQRKRTRPPVPLSPSGDLAPTAEAMTAFLARRAESREAAHTLRAVRRLGVVPKDRGARYAELLLDAVDEVAIETLACFAAWKPDGVLPAVHELYARYPSAHRWEGGVMIDLAGDNATAKAMWEARQGDPNHKRPRPKVVVAVHDALLALTGRDFETPSALAAWMRAAAAPKDKPTKSGAASKRSR